MITGNTETVKVLLFNAGADIHTTNMNGSTSSHLVSRNTGNSRRAMFHRNAVRSIYTTDNHGDTPLHLACRTSGNSETGKRLLNAGANMQITNWSGNAPLHLACRQIGNSNTIKLLVTAGADIHITNWSGNTPLHMACEKTCNTQTVQVLITAGADIHFTNWFGNTPLHMACRTSGNSETVKVLLTAGAKIHTANNDGNTSLHMACRHTGNIETVKVLLIAGADIHATDIDGHTTLHLACRTTGNAETVKVLLTAGADIHTTNNDGYTPLHLACRTTGNSDTAKVLLTAGADILTTDNDGDTPLHLACRETDNTETVKVLLTAGADIHTTNYDGNTPLRLACMTTGNTETVKILLIAGAKFHTTDNNGYTPLHMACRYTGNTETVKVLLSASADIHTTDNDGNTSLHMACGNTGNIEIVKVLLTAGADIHTTNNDGYTPLHLACRTTGNSDTAKVLLTAGADILTTDNDGDTPLHLACRETDNTETIKVLLTAGADIHTTNYDGNTPLRLACMTTGNTETVKILLIAGAKFHTTDNNGYTPLHMACRYTGNTETVKVLLTAGADIHTTNNDGDTPLHLACRETDNTKTVKVLLTAGADIHTTSNGGDTPLHLACRETDNTETVKVLLTAGADMHIADRDGYTPLHNSCMFTGNAETVNVLLTVGGDINHLDNAGHSILYICTSDRFLHKYNRESVCTLIQLGADLVQPLHQAAREVDSTVLGRLCDLGVDVTATDTEGRTALHMIGEKTENLRDILSCIELLVTQGADVNHVSSAGATPLHDICSRPGSDPHMAVDMLIQKGASVIMRSNTGYIPIQIACNEKHLESVTMCLKHGADTSKPLVEMYSRSEHESICALLKVMAKLSTTEWDTLTRTLLNMSIDGKFMAITYLSPHIKPETISVKALSLWAGLDTEGNTPAIISWINKTPVSLIQQDMPGIALILCTTLCADPLCLHRDWCFLQFSQLISTVPGIKIGTKYTLNSLIHTYRNQVPSLCNFCRVVIRSEMVKQYPSLLLGLSKLENENVDEPTISIIFMWDEIISLYPQYSVALKRLFHTDKFDVQHESQENISQVVVIDETDDCISDGLKTILDTNTYTFDFDQCCPKSLQQIHSLPEEILLLHSRIHVSRCGPTITNKCQCSIPKLERGIRNTIATTIQNLQIDHTVTWSLQEYGSFYLDNKITNFDELDFLAIVDSTAIDIQPLSKSEWNVSIPSNHQHSMKCHLKRYIYESVNYAFNNKAANVAIPDRTVVVDSIRMHRTGPGVCVKLSWFCKDGHQHKLAFDLTPAIRWTEKTIADKLPCYFDQKPFKSIREKLSKQRILLVPTSNLFQR